MFCSYAQHGREKKRDILVAETTRESCSPIQPFNLVSALLETSYKTTCSHFFGNSLILSCYAAFHLNWPCISILAQMSIMVAASSFVQFTFICFLVSPLPVDASAAEAILSSSNS